MNAKEKLLAAQLLDAASDEFANHGCNDWNFPKDWTEDERRNFVREYHEWNRDPEEFNPKRLFLPDFAAMAFMAHKVRNEP